MLFFALKDAALAFVAAAAFALCLGVPRRYILLCGLCAALGHSTQAVLLALDFTLALATFAGAALVGILAVILSHQLFVPRVIFAVPGIIPMLPGTFIFHALLSIVQSSNISETTPASIAIEAFSDITRAGVILCALATGIGLPNLLLHYKKPEV